MPNAITHSLSPCLCDEVCVTDIGWIPEMMNLHLYELVQGYLFGFRNASVCTVC